MLVKTTNLLIVNVIHLVNGLKLRLNSPHNRNPIIHDEQIQPVRVDIAEQTRDIGEQPVRLAMGRREDADDAHAVVLTDGDRLAAFTRDKHLVEDPRDGVNAAVAPHGVAAGVADERRGGMEVAGQVDAVVHGCLADGTSAVQDAAANGEDVFVSVLACCESTG